MCRLSHHSNALNIYLNIYIWGGGDGGYRDSLADGASRSSPEDDQNFPDVLHVPMATLHAHWQYRSPSNLVLEHCEACECGSCFSSENKDR